MKEARHDEYFMAVIVWDSSRPLFLWTRFCWYRLYMNLRNNDLDMIYFLPREILMLFSDHLPEKSARETTRRVDTGSRADPLKSLSM